jgi:hypothetical protein
MIKSHIERQGLRFKKKYKIIKEDKMNRKIFYVLVILFFEIIGTNEKVFFPLEVKPFVYCLRFYPDSRNSK